MKKAYRHGDMALEIVDKIPIGLKEKKTSILMEGSHGNNHTFKNGKFFPKLEGEFIFGYFQAKENCILLHPEHGDKKGQAKIEKGFYRLRKQHEKLADELKEVQD